MRGYYFVLSIGLAVPVWIAALFGVYIELIPAPPFESIAAILTAVVMFPVLEELVFRGLLWDLWGIFARKKAGLIASVAVKNCFISICFSLLHAINYGALGAVLVFIPSLWLGWLRERSGSIKVCCLVHVLWNLGYFGVLFLGDTLIAS